MLPSKRSTSGSPSKYGEIIGAKPTAESGLSVPVGGLSSKYSRSRRDIADPNAIQIPTTQMPIQMPSQIPASVARSPPLHVEH
jgi:hypothetical protein